MKIFIILIILPIFWSCDNEQILNEHAEAFPSFASELWKFNNVTFEAADEGYVYITLYHYNDTNGLIDKIVLVNIPTDKDSIHLSYKKEGTNVHSTIPTSYYYVKVGEDALGENYVIDSAKENSYIILDCVSRNRIAGRFRLNYIISNTSLLPKFAPYIPDLFSIQEGRFNAKRL